MRKLKNRLFLANFSRRAFTMVEVIFVIVILGILSIVAIPALSGMREDAMIANERTKIATVRTGL
ncbi:MAG: prepilin-type N-terminal cleavage/methylation domain-containing protein, partial [Helicobacteraceae bacterium]|nr:prepilin-type N-terminal cleavage/methylation domain-containing protein [Helicobacteraceae bacterium]